MASQVGLEDINKTEERVRVTHRVLQSDSGIGEGNHDKQERLNR